MKEQQYLDFDEMIKMKEKRRISRERGKNDKDVEKFKNRRVKQREIRKFSYDPNVNEDFYYED
jgi:hypothetical protein